MKIKLLNTIALILALLICLSACFGEPAQTVGQTTDRQTEQTLPQSETSAEESLPETQPQPQPAVYLDGMQGDDTSDGTSAENAVKTLPRAYELLMPLLSDADSSATLVILSATEVSGLHFNLENTYEHKGTLTVTSLFDSIDYRPAGACLSIGDAGDGKEVRFQLAGPTLFENIVISRSSTKSLTIYVSDSLVMGEGVETVNTNWSFLPPTSGLTLDEAEQIKLSAHRGYQPQGPENSIASFEAAGKLGFWAIETDVRLTADGKLVCIHNDTIDATYNGSGKVAEMTYAELCKYSIDTAKYGVELSSFSNKELTIPLFSEYLAICKKYGCVPFVETKSSLTGSALEEYIKQVIDEAKAAGFGESEIVISSSDMNDLRAVRKLSGEILIHHIFSDESMIAELSKLGNAALAFDIQPLTDDAKYAEAEILVGKAHAAGLQVCLRAGDDIISVKKMSELGLDYIPTNVTSPQSLLEATAGGYTSVSGGKIFIRGGYGKKATDKDISITLLSGAYDFVSASNAENPTTGKYSVTVGGNAFVSRLVSGPTCKNQSTLEQSEVTVKDNATVLDLYTAGDYGVTEKLFLNILGGKVESISDCREGKSGRVQNIIKKPD